MPRQAEKGGVPTNEQRPQAREQPHGPGFLGGDVSEAGGISTHTSQQVTRMKAHSAPGGAEAESIREEEGEGRESPRGPGRISVRLQAAGAGSSPSASSWS